MNINWAQHSSVLANSKVPNPTEAGKHMINLL